MTSRFHRILVPVDFSESSRRAIEHALSLAQGTGASVDLIHVWEPPWTLSADAVSMMAGCANASVEMMGLDQVERDLKAWLEPYRSGPVAVGARLEQGPVADTLLRVMSEGGYDLVVMGTHGRTGLARLMLGSVAQQVSKRSDCPVLTVPEAETSAESAST